VCNIRAQFYHAMNRGDHSEEIFLELSDRELWLPRFLKRAKDALARVA